MAKEGEIEDAVNQPADLLIRAEAALRRIEDEADNAEVTQDSRRELVSTVLLSAIQAAEDGSEEHLTKLEQAIEGAQKMGIHAELRVSGRRLLAKWRQPDRRAQSAEAEVARLSRQLSELTFQLRTCLDGSLGQLSRQSTSTTSSTEASLQEASFRQRQDTCLKQLSRAISEAELAGVQPAATEDAKALVESVKEQRKAERDAAKKLEGLMSISDASQLKEILEQKELIVCGSEVRRVLGNVADHVVRQAEKEQRQSWLLQELAAAGENQDAAQLRRLMTQASSLDLAVPPSVLALVDELEAGDSLNKAFASTSTVRTEKSEKSYADVSEKLAASQARQSKLLRRAIEKAEQHPDSRILDAAQKALAEAKQTRVPFDDITAFERRLVNLENIHRPRLKVEEGLQKLMLQVEEVSIGAVADNVLKDIVQVHHLARLLADGQRFGADEDLLEEADELHERSVEVLQLRRAAADELQSALSRRCQTEADLERLQAAVEECKRLGLNIHTAERQVLRLKELQVNRESTQAELQEASRGVGVQGRLRLETAVRAAKSAGVSAEKLRAASQKLAELREHEQRCEVLAGEVQRALPVLQKHPWRYQQLLEAAGALKPWTSKLERLIAQGKEILDKREKDNARRREVRSQLIAQLKRIEECRASGKSTHDLLVPLKEILSKAESAGLQHDSIQKGKLLLQNARREACQRSVAEHRLQLALNARDHAEIERSMRQVRALGQVGLTDRPSGSRSVARGDRESSGLMEQASSVLRNLTEAEARRQAAAATLQERINAEEGLPALPNTPRSNGAGQSEDVDEGSKNWLRSARSAIQEAKQCGVASTLIEQAKLKLRLKRRERQDQAEACKSLQKVLSKKEVPKQVLLANMTRVQRLQAVKD
mmetsp:Transcript_43294/g.88515  ORF Transcript_43294/g.88515 Transcript_43294/m.88515 type:complete len:889 (+) Transcript_43294:61-2727(+)